jgi:aminoglycoside phosphotransferase (APT) family kinase protein
MHDGEVDTDASLVRRLLVAQFPEWADLSIERVRSKGTDNAIYRLGDDMAVRLPRIDWAIDQVDKEHRWLSKLAPHLPLAIPVPVARGSPAEGYPWEWGVYRWLEGDEVTIGHLADLDRAAADLAAFVVALHGIDPTGGPPGGRGEPLSTRDAETRAAIASMEGTLDAAAVTQAWEAALRVPEWGRPPVWTHGDIQPGNLLAVDGRITAVIDFGVLGLGDPSCDLIVAWNLLSGESRVVFRAAIDVDDATWARGRGWALSVALLYIPYYLHTNPAGVEDARRVVEEVLLDHASGS